MILLKTHTCKIWIKISAHLFPDLPLTNQHAIHDPWYQYFIFISKKVSCIDCALETIGINMDNSINYNVSHMLCENLIKINSKHSWIYMRNKMENESMSNGKLKYIERGYLAMKLRNGNKNKRNRMRNMKSLELFSPFAE